MTRTLLLVGTRRAPSSSTATRTATDWSMRGPLCEGWPIHDLSVGPGDGLDPRRRRHRRGTARRSSAATTSARPGRHSSEGTDLRRRRAEDPDGLERRRRPTARIFAGVEPAGLFRSDDGGATWRHVVGPARPSEPRPGWSPGAGGLICHTIVPHPTDADRMWVAISAVGTFATEDGGATWEARNRGVARLQPPDPYPGDRPVRPQARDGRRRAGHALPAEPLRRLSLGRRRARAGQTISAGLPSEFGFVMGAHPRDPATVWVIPLSHPEEGRSRRAARSRSGGPATAATPGSARATGLPQKDAYVGVLPRGAGGRSARPGRRLLRDEHRPALRLDRRGRVAGSRIADNLPPIWGVEASCVD